MGRHFEVRPAALLSRANQKAKVYSRYSKEILMAAKNGEPDPEMNQTLKKVIERAKANNVPADVIKRAIEKAKSNDTENYSSARYEGFGSGGGSSIIIDCLTLTASAQQKEVKETLRAIKMVKKELGVHTVLGVSNVSFGLPNRPLLNRTFLALAMEAGLDLPIINPLDAELMGTIDAFHVLFYKDVDSQTYIKNQSKDKETKPAAAAATTNFTLKDVIIHGLKDEVEKVTKEELKDKEALTVINEVIIPALNIVGKDYETGKIFLPQLIQSAETTKKAFEVVKETFSANDGEEKGPIIIATVEGDIHDIGKNIVKVVLESYGYKIIDLGKDVKVEKVVEAYKKYKPKAIGLSALMTTTVASMERTIKALHEAGCSEPIWVGGAVVTEDIAHNIGADYYTEDAMAAVNLLENEILIL